MNRYSLCLLLPFLFFVAACKGSSEEQTETPEQPKDSVGEYGAHINLAEPLATPSSTKESKVVGWPEGKTPIVAAGYRVIKFAGGLQHPRWIYVAQNGDVFVAESQTEGTGANRITLFRDSNGDGVADNQSVFLEGLNKPLGMLVMGNSFLVANTDGVLKYPYKLGDAKITTAGEKILSLPAGGYNNHWTRNLLMKPDSSKIYVSVGSGSNVG